MEELKTLKKKENWKVFHGYPPLQLLFSKAKLTFSDYRKRLSPDNLEMLLFLKMHHDQLTTNIVSNTINNN